MSLKTNILIVGGTGFIGHHLAKKSLNLGSGKPKKIKNIIKDIKKIANGGYPQFGKIKLRKDEILKLYPNIKKANKKINWKPKILFEKGLKSTIKYYNEQSR